MCIRDRVTVTEQFIRDNTPIESFDEPAADYAAMLSRLERMLERAKLAYVEGIDTIDEYSANKNKIMAEIDEINAMQREAENKKEYLSKEEVESRLFDIISLLKSDTGKDEKYEAISSSVENIEDVYKRQVLPARCCPPGRGTGSCCLR